jgi:hypothetical protein
VRRAALALLLAAVYVLSSASVAAEALLPSPAKHHRVALNYGNAVFDDAKIRSYQAARRVFWVGQGFQSVHIDDYKAGNPAIESYLYKDALLSNDNGLLGDHPKQNTGVGYVEADAEHPDWFLLNSSGQRQRQSANPYHVFMDLGNAGYQQRWVDNVLRQLRREGWTGVFMDDVSLKLWGATGYSSDAAYQAAARSFLVNVAGRIRSAGFKVLVNGASSVNYPAVTKDWMSLVDGWMEEGWMRSSVAHSGTRSGVDALKAQTDLLRHAQATGKRYVASIPADAMPTCCYDWPMIRYGLAAYMLVTNGTRASVDVEGDNGTRAYFFAHDLWLPEYDTIKRMGGALGAYTVRTDGVYQRLFERGLVLVNPTDSTKTITLTGRHSGSGLSGVTKVTLAARSGVVLERT